MDSTYAAALAIARRILNCEVARLANVGSVDSASTTERTTHAAPAVALPR
jgi:hypothetical protein